VGAPRSGTTLLRLILDHHSQLCIAGEFEWTLDSAPSPGGQGLDAYYAALAVDRSFHHYGVQIDRGLELDDLIRDFLRQMKQAQCPDKPIAGASIHDHYLRFHRLWPDARYIHIVRDGRDVCSSWMEHGWVGDGYRGGQDWSRLIEQWFQLHALLPQGRSHELRFEDLVRDPERETARICAFLGLTYEPTMLEYWRDTTYGPINARESGKWPRSMPAKAVQRFENTAGQWLRHYEYPPSDYPPRQIGTLERQWLPVEERLNRARVEIKKFGLPLWLGEHVMRRVGPRSLHDAVLLRRNAITESRLK